MKEMLLLFLKMIKKNGQVKLDALLKQLIMLLLH